MTIDERLAALGLTVKPKRQTRDINSYDVTNKDDRVKLRAIAKNKMAHESTREDALALLEAYAASKAKGSKA